MIPYGRQEVTQADIDAVLGVLQSDFLTQGPAVPRFEGAVREHCGVAHAVAVSSATAALHLACLALDLGPGDLLWTSPNTFVASANCGLYCGAKVDFVDIDPCTYNMSAEALAVKLRDAAAHGQLPKVVVPVHFGGQTCDMRAIHELAKRYGFRIIEDASHAIGGSYLGEPIGNCRFSDITVFSFHPVKIVTTGEGGMAVTNDLAAAEKLVQLRSHGITREAAAFVGTNQGPWYYEQLDLGFNYRMTDLQAALGHSQMRRLPLYVDRRGELARRYGTLLQDLPVITPWQDSATVSAWHLYVVRLKPESGKLRRDVFQAMRKAGIGVNVHYIPVHMQPYYQELGFREGMFPAAERYYSEVMSLPMFPRLTEAQQDSVVAALREALL